MLYFSIVEELCNAKMNRKRLVFIKYFGYNRQSKHDEEDQ